MSSFRFSPVQAETTWRVHKREQGIQEGTREVIRTGSVFPRQSLLLQGWIREPGNPWGGNSPLPC